MERRLPQLQWCHPAVMMQQLREQAELAAVAAAALAVIAEDGSTCPANLHDFENVRDEFVGMSLGPLVRHRDGSIKGTMLVCGAQMCLHAL